MGRQDGRLDSGGVVADVASVVRDQICGSRDQLLDERDRDEGGTVFLGEYTMERIATQVHQLACAQDDFASLDRHRHCALDTLNRDLSGYLVRRK